MSRNQLPAARLPALITAVFVVGNTVTERAPSRKVCRRVSSARPFTLDLLYLGVTFPAFPGFFSQIGQRGRLLLGFGDSINHLKSWGSTAKTHRE